MNRMSSPHHALSRPASHCCRHSGPAGQGGQTSGPRPSGHTCWGIHIRGELQRRQGTRVSIVRSSIKEPLSIFPRVLLSSYDYRYFILSHTSPPRRSLRFGQATYPEGHRYEGEWHQGQRCGFGEFWTQSAGEYAGEWKDDVMHGEWRECMPYLRGGGGSAIHAGVSE